MENNIENKLIQNEVSIAELRTAIKELVEEHKKTELAQQKTEETLKKVAKQLGGIGNNNGEIAQQYFFRGLKHKMSLNGISFKDVSQKLKNKFNGIEAEYDIVLTNSDSIVIVEVKYSINPNDIDKFYSDIQNFKVLFPMYKDYKIYGSVASFAFPDDAIQLAKNYGFFILAKAGKDFEILNHDAKIIVN